MAGRREIRCIGPSYPLTDRKLGQRSVNLYLSAIDALGEDKPLVLKSAPGLKVFVDVNETRGSWDADGRWFAVLGSSLVELDVTNPAYFQIRGTLATTTGFVAMKHGRNQLVLVDGPNGYVLNLGTNVFGQIIDPDWRGSNWVEELDGYFIFADPGTDQFYLSAIDDATVLDALDFSSADSQYDLITTFRVLHKELLLMGPRSIEVWIDSGGADFPFIRYSSAPIDVGVVGNRAAINVADTLVWVGQTGRGNGIVYEMRGHQPVRISNTAVEQALTSSTDLSQCSMWTYQIEGAEFVGINAPGMETTWVYDFASKQWHERGEMISGQWNPSRVRFVVFSNDVHMALSSGVNQGSALLSYRLYYLSENYPYIDNFPISNPQVPLPHVRERTWPHLVSPSMEPISYRELELACTTGETAVIAYGQDPLAIPANIITLEISNDGGQTFFSPLQRSLGAIGRWVQRVRWCPLGSAMDRVFRLRCSSQVTLTIHAANLDAS